MPNFIFRPLTAVDWSGSSKNSTFDRIYFQFVDLTSSRNVFIIGVSMYMGLVVPMWAERTLRDPVAVVSTTKIYSDYFMYHRCVRIIGFYQNYWQIYRIITSLILVTASFFLPEIYADGKWRVWSTGCCDTDVRHVPGGCNSLLPGQHHTWHW